MSFGQAVEANAFAQILHRAPHMKHKCKVARISFEGDKFIVIFAEKLEDLG
jgi:hypothetical protein